MGAFHFFELVQVRQNRNGLQRLPQTHLIRENPVDAVFVVPNQPVQAFQLVRPHGSLDHRGLLQQPRAALVVGAFQRLGVAL